ncbi:hypothetical protein ACOSP7_025580 [Xanthoceras sorbifolium]|uniref:Pectinesterase inhibitor domain-containing protein n=1 Tax=Xanthoceras sorbifolium TaxID=99658 RepID=A0ABQ8H6M0_9ROSI|nr:hypothetical protein JRO89_XS13G0050900 [Xanthoceras sorbifolium]
MEGSFAHALVALLMFFMFSTNTVSSTVTTSTLDSETNIEYIKTSCSATIYPRLCYHSLSIYASDIKTNPKVLASTALNITLKATKSTARMMIKMSKIHGLMPKEAAAAMADCIEVIGDSVDELQQSIEELGHVRNSNFWLTMNDIETWVSAALTDEDTCMDGFQGKAMNANVKTLIRRHIVRVVHYTSNALSLINRYASKNLASP